MYLCGSFLCLPQKIRVFVSTIHSCFAVAMTIWIAFVELLILLRLLFSSCFILRRWKERNSKSKQRRRRKPFTVTRQLIRSISLNWHTFLLHICCLLAIRCPLRCRRCANEVIIILIAFAFARWWTWEWRKRCTRMRILLLFLMIIIVILWLLFLLLWIEKRRFELLENRLYFFI